MRGPLKNYWEGLFIFLLHLLKSFRKGELSYHFLLNTRLR